MSSALAAKRERFSETLTAAPVRTGVCLAAPLGEEGDGEGDDGPVGVPSPNLASLSEMDGEGVPLPEEPL